MNDSTKIILKKMGKSVGADFDKIDFKKDNWFWDYEWAQEQENEFKVWMFEYLMDNKKARDEIMETPEKDKFRIGATVDEFIFQYGWKVKNV